MTGLALVTGGSGWLGRRLLGALAHGLEEVPGLQAAPERRVRALVKSEEDERLVRAAHPGAELIYGDLEAPQSLAALCRDAAGATLFHSAGVVHPASVRDFYRVNAEGTRALLAQAIDAGVQRFVHVSSNSPLGCNPSPDHVFDEQSTYRPYLNYGRSKKLAEDAVIESRERIQTVIVRPPWFYGPGQPPRQTTFFRMIREGRFPLVGGGNNKRSMAYVDNICQGLLLAEQCDRAAGEIYWIADSRPYSMREIVATVADVLETDFGMTVKRKQLRLPGIASECALAADKVIQGLGLYHQKIHVLSEMNKTIACSIDKARRELGYEPRIALREGMRRSVQAVLDEGGEI